MLSRSVAGAGAVLLVVAGSVSACEDDKPSAATASSAVASADGGANAPSVDPRIAKALESAAAKSAGTAAAEDGPPLNGVFGPGDADKAHPQGAPRKLEVFSDGSEPRVQLAGTASALPRTTTVSVAQRIGPQAMPTLVYTLGIKTAKADADDAAGAGAPPKASKITITVKEVGLAKTQPGAVPRDLDKEIAKLKGSSIAAELAADGAWRGPTLVPSKTADQGLLPALQALVGVIDLAWVPAPSKPVGSGAYWMVVDRARPAGIEVVRYRVYRVTAVDGKTATMSVDVRQYSIGGLVNFPGAPEGLVLTALGMNSMANGTVTAVAGSGLPQAAQLQLPVQLQMEAKDRPGQAMVLQAEVGYSLQGPQAAGTDAAPAEPTAQPAPAPAPPATP